MASFLITITDLQADLLDALHEESFAPYMVLEMMERGDDTMAHVWAKVELRAARDVGRIAGQLYSINDCHNGNDL